uniref:Reverse transcriptase domain-containing protein n=1 Tax=Tanacetum cinerariifolium TaxID=118510 RepID=A0A6L2LN40_TANCI|nr:hypothetical protein [Tanacetum cinerariifolium]
MSGGHSTIKMKVVMSGWIRLKKDGKLLICCECEGRSRGGFCWFCASRAETSFANDPNLSSFDDSQNISDYSPQPQYETYLCELCENDSHYGYDCPPRFPLVYEQEPSYNQNYNKNYFPHNSPSFHCCDNCEGPNESFQCQSMNQNFFEPNPYYEPKSSSFDQFQPHQFFDVHQPSKEISIDELKIMMQSYYERMNQQQSLQNFKVVHRMSSISITSQISSVIAIAPILPTEEPKYSLSMRDEHLSTISETESDQVIKSSVENFVPIPSETELTYDNEITSNEDVLMIYSNSLFDDKEIIPTKIDPHYFNTESDLIESLLNQDTLIDSSPKFNYLLEEFSGELAHIDPIPSGIKEADLDLEEEIRLVESLLYDNSSPRMLEQLNAEITDTIVESFSPSPIPVEDSDSQMKEIDLFLVTDDFMPPDIENDNYDWEGDIHFLKELLSSDPLSLLEIKSSNFDHHNKPSFPRPPPEPPDVEICFDFEPDTGVLTAKVVKGISEHYVFMPNILPSLPTLNFDTLLPFSFKNEDKVFKPGILSYLLVSHRDKIIFDFSENPMMMYGGNILHLDVSFLHIYPP